VSVAERWGLAPREAYGIAFGLVLALEASALVWLLLTSRWRD
jgi:hypothetical protein